MSPSLSPSLLRRPSLLSWRRRRSHLPRFAHLRSSALGLAALAGIGAFLTLTLPGRAQVSITSRPNQAIYLVNFHPFNGSDGSRPDSGPIQGQDGFFYGVTRTGGANNLGAIYRLLSTGQTVTLYSFTGGADGFYPSSSLYLAADGRFYGVTNGFTNLPPRPAGGANPSVTPTGVATYGGVYRFTLPASPTATTGTLQTLHTFTGGANDGSDPRGAIVSGPNGLLFGTTVAGGGTPNPGSPGLSGGYGTVYTINPTNDDAYSIVHSFSNNDYVYDEYDPTYNDGAYPVAGLTVVPNESGYGFFLCGTTASGGANGRGTLFGVYAGEGIGISKFYDFTGGVDGANPYDDLVLAGDGNLYGTTSTGGNGDLTGYNPPTGNGTIFRVNLSDILFDRLGARPVATPSAGPTTSATPTGLTILHTFDAARDGLFPNGLTLASDGSLFGSTAGVTGDGVTPPPDTINPGSNPGPGGNPDNGTIFRITLEGAFTTLYSFVGSYDGGGPRGGLVQGFGSEFYGVNNYGGNGSNADLGNIFYFYAFGNFAFDAFNSTTPFTYRVNERDGNAVITVSRLNGGVGAASVDYATADGTAAAGRDYVAANGTLRWGDGDTSSRVFVVPIINNSVVDGQRSLQLSLSNAVGSALSGGTTATLLINDDDATVTPIPTPTPTPIPPTPTPTPPPAATDLTLTLTSPPDNIAVVSGTPLPLVANVTDPANSLSGVQFYLNGALVGQVNAAPYILTITAPANGTYQLDVVATDTQGRQARVTRTFGVVTPDPANPVPSISVLTDLNGRAFAAGSIVPVTAQVDAPAPGDTLARVDFYADGALFASLDNAGNPLVLPAPSQTVSGNRPTRQDSPLPAFNGTIFKADYTMPGTDKLVNIVMVALSKLGRAQVSAPVTLQSVASTADRPPIVAVTTNKKLVRVGKSFRIPAAISDPDAATASAASPPNGPRQLVRRAFDTSGVIARVEYYLNALKVKDSAEAPFTFDFTPPAEGTYVATVIATDGAGLATVSEPLTLQAIGGALVSVTPIKGGTASEGGRVRALFTRVSGDVSEDLTVNYELKGNATNGEDYVDLDGQPLSGSITIPAGATSAKLRIQTLQDDKIEGPEKLNVKLLPSASGDYVIGDSPRAKLLILDVLGPTP